MFSKATICLFIFEKFRQKSVPKTYHNFESKFCKSVILECSTHQLSKAWTDNHVFRHHHTLHDDVPLSKQLMLFYYHPIKHASDQTKRI